jgi:hypothetical protein
VLLSRVFHDDTGWLAVGSAGPDVNSPGTTTEFVVFTSDDSRRWVERGAYQLPPQSEGSLSDAAYGNGALVLSTHNVGWPGGGGLLARTSDGSWTGQNHGGFPTQILFGNGTFLSAQLEPVSSVSIDGVTWRSLHLEGMSTNYWFDGERFGCLTSAGTVRTSSDGESWSAPVPSPEPLLRVDAVTPVGEQMLGFATLGDQRVVQLLGPRGTPLGGLAVTPSSWTAGAGQIAASDTTAVVVGSTGLHSTPLPVGTNGWSDIPAPGGAIVTSLAYGNGTFVLVGSTATSKAFIATSPDGLDWTVVLPDAM